MIELRLKTQVNSLVKEPNPSGPILQHLAERLDREKFFGKINLTFADGMLQNIKVEQSFTVQDLANTLIRS